MKTRGSRPLGGRLRHSHPSLGAGLRNKVCSSNMVGVFIRSQITVPLQQPTADHFSDFDDQATNLLGNLQLDAEDEPRRIGSTSRANSVRFDETANQGHWSRQSLDLIPRTGSGFGGHSMSERSYSHKSDGRQSSAGHSVHSVTSGRANSLTGYGLNTPVEPPGVAPGFFILGPVPAIIRCWLDTNFKHDTLLYAAVCSGSCASHLDIRLIERLGFQNRMTSEEGVRKLKMTVYLPEAVPTRSSSPAPQLPSLCVEFNVLEQTRHDEDSKAIQIILGSDVLRAHNADILFSTNHLTLYDDEGSKLQIPLVRPEDERSFKYMLTSSGTSMSTRQEDSKVKNDDTELEDTNMEEVGAMRSLNGGSTATTGKQNGMAPISRPVHSVGNDGSIGQRPSLGLSTGSVGSREGGSDSPTSAAPRSGAGTSPAIWHQQHSWRRDTEKANLDWANGVKDGGSYQRRDTSMKVLKPMRTLSRSLSSSAPQNAGAVTPNQSRFFDDGKRRVGNVSGNDGIGEPQLKRSVSGEKGKEALAPSTKARAANPVGGASAFAWLKSGDAK